MSTILSHNHTMSGSGLVGPEAAKTSAGTGIDRPTAGTEWAVIREVTRKVDGKKTIAHFKTQALCDAWFANIIDQRLGVGLDMPAATMPELLFYFETLEAKDKWIAANLAKADK